MKELKEILKGLSYSTIAGSDELMVNAVVFDSRNVTSGCLFVAVKGFQTDGHKFIDAAIEKGAAVIVCEQYDGLKGKSGVNIIGVKDSSYALGAIAASFYDNPSLSLTLVGVTGTNGKTTVATLLYKLFSGLGYKCGLISTVENIIVTTSFVATHTTPDPVALNKTIHDMVVAGCDYVFMEVSSHALDQKRVAGLKFKGALFTNITHDHLDYHKTFDSYLKAKKSFFDNLESDSFALVNRDDRNGAVMLQNCNAAKTTYSMSGMADFRGSVIENSIAGLSLRFGENEFWSLLVGEFNAYNLLAVYGTAILLGTKAEETLKVLSGLTSVSGRFEIIRSSDGVTGIVDYAHTPDALENVLTTIRDTRESGSRVITVVGAGGDRDRSKRPVMARVAASLSDRLILTSDNPRSEEPNDIIEEMRSGLDNDSNSKTLSITDRHQAIKTAVMLALSGDIILIAGKGHETYQEVKGVRSHFDDREELISVFNNIKRN